MPTTTPKIIDLTVREGGFQAAHQVPLEFVTELTRELARSGIQYAEVSHGCGIGGKRKGYSGLFHDKDLLKAARLGSSKLTYSVYLDCSPGSLTEIELVDEYFQIGRIGISVPDLDQSQDHVKKLKKFGKTVFVQLLRIHRHSPSEVADAASKLKDSGGDVVVLSDSYGSMSGDDVKEYFQAVRDKTDIPLGFNGRNNTCRALHNAWTAYQNGAEWFDASLLGLGRDAGISNLEVLASIFQRNGLVPEIDARELNNAVSWVVLPRFKQAPTPAYLDLLFSKYKIEIYPKEFIPILAEILGCSPEEFIAKALQTNPNALEIGQPEIRDLLAAERLDFDVVMEYIKTGKVPEAS